MNEYKGTIELISGLTPKNGCHFALIHAKDVQMNDGTRLSECGAVPIAAAEADGKLLQIKNGKWEAAAIGETAVGSYIDAYIAEALGGDY